MADELTIGEGVKLKSGGHEMVVQEIKEDGITCIWSDGKRARKETLNHSLVAKVDRHRINIQMGLYSDKDVDELVAEMRGASTTADDSGFYIADEKARSILKR